MRRHLLFIALVPACLWLSGCMFLEPERDWRTDAPDFRRGTDAPLRTALDAYAPGDTVALSLTNDTARIVSYNLCASTLERRLDEGWEPQPADFACTLELRTLSPGQTDTFPYPLRETLPEGSYRFTNRIELFEINENRLLTSNVFQVR